MLALFHQALRVAVVVASGKGITSRVSQTEKTRTIPYSRQSSCVPETELRPAGGRTTRQPPAASYDKSSHSTYHAMLEPRKHFGPLLPLLSCFLLVFLLLLLLLFLFFGVALRFWSLSCGFLVFGSCSLLSAFCVLLLLEVSGLLWVRVVKGSDTGI